MPFTIIVSLAFIILTDLLLGCRLKKWFQKKGFKTIYLLHSLLFILCVLVIPWVMSKTESPERHLWTSQLIAVIFLFYVPKLLYLVLYGFGYLFKKHLPSLFHIVDFTARGIAIILFIVQLYSITGGRYNYKITNVEVPVTHLPANFDGFKIVQLSDIHLGSYGKNYKGISRLVEEVNGLHPDLIVFTGDMVNNMASEMPHWIPVLRQLHAPYGKYAVTGNHDYGHYVRWDSREAREENMRQFYKNMQAMGFHMLDNTHVPLTCQHDTLWLAGVENWGNPPFPRYGKLDEALRGLSPEAPVILLSHDPSHWRGEVLSHPIPLTLSGHTHAMQAGIQIGNWEWSPSKYFYPEYDGLYREGKQYLHVSRGQGFIGYPGRVGLRPVITQITLKQETE